MRNEFIAYWAARWAKKKGRELVFPAHLLPRHAQRSHSCGAQVALRKARVNTLLKRGVQTIKIIHPTHPLRGQTFEEVPLYGGKPDPNGILIALPNGKRQLIPLAWTDQVSQIEYPANTYFLPDNLIRLRQQLDDLIKQGEKEKVIIMATEPEDIEPGGSRYVSRSNPMESGDARTARPDHCDSGADAARLLDAGNGGGQ